MAEAGATALAANQVNRRLAFVRWVRRTHGWFGLWGAILGLLMGFSGIWLNHRNVLKLELPGQQQINGEHLVGPDGTVNLGIYGTVYVAGLTTDVARATIEAHLKQFLDSPEVAVSIFAYNSKVYYVITEGAGFGDNLARFPGKGGQR